MKTTLYLMLIIFLVYSSSNIYSNEQKKNKLIVFPKKVFGIEISTLTYNAVIKVLKAKKIKYKAFTPESSGDGISGGTPTTIITTYFIGTGIDNAKLKRIVYHFSPISGGVDIELEFEKENYETLVKLLTYQYGQPNKKIINIKNKIDSHWEWKTQELIALSEGLGLYFYEGFGLVSSDDMVYLLLRGGNQGCQHAH